MGYFTWTDARCKKPRLKKDGYEYYASDKIGYDCWCKVICPDNTEIIEPSYYGYGIFGGKDVYDLVVDWNKDRLAEIFRMRHLLNPNGFWGQNLEPLALAYQNNAPEYRGHYREACGR